jgi:Na+-driven multidrug efflux pump
MAMGAGNVFRARRVAWTAGGRAAFHFAIIGGLVSIALDLWGTDFNRELLEYTRQHLRWASPGFGLHVLGFALYFVTQGSGKNLRRSSAGHCNGYSRPAWGHGLHLDPPRPGSSSP